MRLSRMPIVAAVVAFLGGAAVETFRERASAPEEPTRHVVTRRSGQQTLETEAVHLPHGSIWPAGLAAGVTLLAFGVLTSYAFSAIGLVVFVLSLAEWVGELRHE